jgi:hypothetical protein
MQQIQTAFHAGKPLLPNYLKGFLAIAFEPGFIQICVKGIPAARQNLEHFVLGRDKLNQQPAAGQLSGNFQNFLQGNSF